MSTRHGEYKVPGGKLVVVDLHEHDGRLAHVQVAGDFFLEPDSALDDIRQALEGQPITADTAQLAAAIRAALPPDAVLFGFSPEAVANQATAGCVGPHIVEVGKRLRIARLAAPGHAVRRQHLKPRPAGQCGRPQRQATLQPGTSPNPDLSGNIHTHSHPPPRRKHQPAL